MPTLMQKFRLAFRGWQRRRREADQAFVAGNTAWARRPSTLPSNVAVIPPPGPEKQAVDLEGLQVAFLDESGRIDYYLDTRAGDVVEVRESARNDAMPAHFRRVPRRTAESEAEDRAAFVSTIESATVRAAVGDVAADPSAFRLAISGDRSVERAWYNFKNDRASATIATWLKSLG